MPGKGEHVLDIYFHRTDWAIGVLHDLVDTIYQVCSSGYVRLCAATNLLRAEFISQLGESPYRRMEEICTAIEVADGPGSA